MPSAFEVKVCPKGITLQALRTCPPGPLGASGNWPNGVSLTLHVSYAESLGDKCSKAIWITETAVIYNRKIILKRIRKKKKIAYEHMLTRDP